MRLINGTETDSTCMVQIMKLSMELDVLDPSNLPLPEWTLLWSRIKRYQISHVSLKVRRACIVFTGYMLSRSSVVKENLSREDILETWMGYLEEYSHETQSYPLRKAVTQSLVWVGFLGQKGLTDIRTLRYVWIILRLLQDDDETIRTLMTEQVSPWRSPECSLLVPTRFAQNIYRKAGEHFGDSMDFHYQFLDHLLESPLLTRQKIHSGLFIEERSNMFIEKLFEQQLCYLALRNSLCPQVCPLYLKRAPVALQEWNRLLLFMKSEVKVSFIICLGAFGNLKKKIR